MCMCPIDIIHQLTISRSVDVQVAVLPLAVTASIHMYECVSVFPTIQFVLLVGLFVCSLVSIEFK